VPARALSGKLVPIGTTRSRIGLEGGATTGARSGWSRAVKSLELTVDESEVR
jgi:hypothetical protein